MTIENRLIIIIVIITDKEMISISTITNRKKSKQREAILSFIKSRKDHPTASEVYSHLREFIHNISLGTVYRNLALLEEDGQIRMISLENQPARYDGAIQPHYHFVCQECGKVMDMEDMPIQHDWNNQANEHFSGEIHSHQTVFYGICSECLKSNYNKGE